MQIYQIDAFTDSAFAGNPAAVCILSEKMEDDWMQNLAAEMNLSETAFIYREGKNFNLRWFTPSSEVDLCGHAALASAQTLWEAGEVGSEEKINFDTKSGILTAEKNGSWIELNFPAEIEEAADIPENMTKALGQIEIVYSGKNRMDYLLEVESEEIVKNIEPDFDLLKKIDTRGIIVTAISASDKYDFVSRFFAPNIGITEDPVTGSAHCCLGPYWSEKLNKNSLIGFQASERGGTVRVKADGNRINLSGKAVTIFRGELLV